MFCSRSRSPRCDAHERCARKARTHEHEHDVRARRDTTRRDTRRIRDAIRGARRAAPRGAARRGATRVQHKKTMRDGHHKHEGIHGVHM